MQKKIIKITNEIKKASQSIFNKEKKDLRQRHSVSVILPNIQKYNQKKEIQPTHLDQHSSLQQLKLNKKTNYIVKRYKSLNRVLFSVIENQVKNENQSSNNSSMNITRKIKFLKLQNKLIQKQINKLCRQNSFDDNSKQQKQIRNVSLFSQEKENKQFLNSNNFKINKKSSKQLSKKIRKNDSSLNEVEQYAQKYICFYQNLSKNQSIYNDFSMSKSQIQQNKQKGSIKKELQKFSILDDMKKYFIKKKQRMPSILANIQFNPINQA